MKNTGGVSRSYGGPDAPASLGLSALAAAVSQVHGCFMTTDTSVLETVRELVDHTTAEKVYGSPITQDGITVLPVAKTSGGGGGGSGTAPGEDGAEAGGTGGGLGLTAKPLGVYIMKDGRVSWRPAIDINKIILGGQVVAAAGLLVAAALIRSRRRRAARS